MSKTIPVAILCGIVLGLLCMVGCKEEPSLGEPLSSANATLHGDIICATVVTLEEGCNIETERGKYVVTNGVIVGREMAATNTGHLVVDIVSGTNTADAIFENLHPPPRKLWDCPKHGEQYQTWCSRGTVTNNYCMECWADRAFKGLTPLKEATTKGE